MSVHQNGLSGRLERCAESPRLHLPCEELLKEPSTLADRLGRLPQPQNERLIPQSQKTRRFQPDNTDARPDEGQQCLNQLTHPGARLVYASAAQVGPATTVVTLFFY